MKYIDIQLTDKELWRQFQTKYQAGEYADALSLLQTLTPNSKTYVWEKYDAIAPYRAVSDTNGTKRAPSDISGSGHRGYTIDTATGVFTLTGEGYDDYPKFYASASPNRIYELKKMIIANNTMYGYFTINAVQGDLSKGDTCYGTVTAEDEAAYPADGGQDGYWYVLVSETAEGGYKGLIAKVLNTLTDYIVRVENLNDSTFKADRLPVQASQPTQTTGQIWFQVTN